MKNPGWPIAAYFTLFFCYSVASAAPAPELLVERTRENRPTLLVLGSAHFANPGLDNINIEVDDVLSDDQQREIQMLVDKLLEFEPTHIAVEVSYSNQESLNSYYQGYINDTVELNRSEASQIGLRLARMLGHEQVYAIDWQGSPPGGFTDDYNWHEYGLANGHDDRIAAINDPAMIERYARQGERSITHWIRDMNSEEGLLAFHRPYFDIALIGTDENSPGASWVGHWYTRNLMIFNNIVRLAQDTNDRVLVIYGASHAYPLRQFAIESGGFNIVEVGDVL